MPGKESALFWRKKEFVSYLLSVLVFLIHISSFSQHENSGTLITHINETVAYFFKKSITRFAVPAFFILSGASFFRNYSLTSYLGKLKSRFYTLLIPYLIWNCIWMLFDIVCSNTFLCKFFIGRQQFEITLINVLKSIFFYKCNLPFWFIFNLIVFSIFSPLIDLLISQKHLAFLSLASLIILHVFGIHIPSVVFYEPNSLLYYFIGAIVGKYYWKQFTQKSTRLTQYCSIAFLCLYFTIKTIHHPVNNSILSPLFNVVLLGFCAFCLWNSVDLIIDNINPKPFLARSFAVYAMHINVSAVITKLIALVFRKNEFLAFPNMILTLIFSLLFINFFCATIEKHFPKIYSLIMGKRDANSQRNTAQ